jgi:2-amino-4-hydroxy-6-hydroxymethyldihydropteridine diphosphokinase
MTPYGWKSKFNKIRKEFDYSELEDERSARKLNSMLNRKLEYKRLKNIINKKTVFIIGAGPSLLKSLDYVKKNKNVSIIVADGAVQALLEKNIKPSILVTDLDGDLDSIKKIGKLKIPIVVHAHGDNYEKLDIVKQFTVVIGTTQTNSFGKLENFGGFTDGDRCVFLAEFFGARKIILIGMDFGTKIGKYSKVKRINRKIKLKKLKCGKDILEWFGRKSKAELYSINTIRGFKKIEISELTKLI